MSQSNPNVQRVFTDDVALLLESGQSLKLPVYYSATDAELSGLTLNVHFNSSLLRLLDFESTISAALSVANIFDDAADLDSDPLTDQYLQGTSKNQEFHIYKSLQKNALRRQKV